MRGTQAEVDPNHFDFTEDAFHHHDNGFHQEGSCSRCLLFLLEDLGHLGEGDSGTLRLLVKLNFKFNSKL